ncbi:hypothetical protein VaNZ11_009635 [Volvox africanus]|uniref:Zinc/iron permease n=1 Tax=Volvox africanus TaxID=51714 RepID=A0ABQ5S839_9CHLO|nr:hypothetical protein VaNZ11_009635 [Volvox africanus]
MPGPGRRILCVRCNTLPPFSAHHFVRKKAVNLLPSARSVGIHNRRLPSPSHFASPIRTRYSSGTQSYFRRRVFVSTVALPVATTASSTPTVIIASAPTAVHAMASSVSEGAGALWATCLVLFAGAMLTGLPPVCWWVPSPAGKAAPATRIAALLQGPSLRMLSAGLMLGSGLGVVVPEGFITFVEGEPGGGSGLPEWSAGAGLLAGFVCMLALQLWLQGDGHTHAPAATAIYVATAAPTAAGGSEGVGTGDRDRGPEGSGYGRSSAGWRRRWDGGYSALPSAAAADAEMSTVRFPSGPSVAATAVAVSSGVTGSMELTRRHGGTLSAAGGGGGGDGDGAAAAAAPSAHVSFSCALEGVVPASALPKPGCAASPPSSSHAASGVGDGDGSGNGNGSGGAAIAASSSLATPGSVTSGGGVSSAKLALGGLLIHSAADGLAIGAASLGGGGGGGPSALSLSVAAAIMMHKLPVTLGLTTYLREAGWRRGAVLQALLGFSASAPLAALAAYYFLGMLLQGTGRGTADDPSASGNGVSGQVVALAVLFSGGTFLAAATQHILPAALAAAAPTVAATDMGLDKHLTNVEGAVLTEEETFHVGGVGRGCGTSLPLLWLAVGSLLPLLIAALLPEAG